MKIIKLQTLKYLSYSFFISLVISHTAPAEASKQNNTIQQQEKTYYAQQKQLEMLDKAQDKKHLTEQQHEMEAERLYREALQQDKNAYLAAMEQQQAEQRSNSQNDSIQYDIDIETALDNELQEYDRRLEMQPGY